MRRSRLTVVTTLYVAVLVGMPLSTAVMGAERPSDRYILVRVPVQPGDVGNLIGLGLDVWGTSPDHGTFDLRVSPAELEDLRARGYLPQVIDPDVYATWARVRDHRPQPVDVGGWTWDHYHNLDTTNAHLAALHATYPDLAEFITIGESVEGRPINGLRISDEAATIDPTEPAMFIVGCHHAREWISVEVPLYIAERLLTDYGTDPQVTSLLNRSEIWIVPCLNPDGYLYTELVDPLWRKNRRPNPGGTFGIDLNRNYSYQWGGSGSSGNPGSETYRGPAPFSEPETAAVREVYDTRNFIGGLTYHNRSQYVMSAWGYTTAPPPDSPVMEALVAEMAQVINSHHSNPQYDYVSGRWGVLLYIGDGIFVDWVYGVHHVMSAIVELRPRSGSFYLPEDQILETCIENFYGALHMMETLFGADNTPASDFDGDGDVDADDYDYFLQCISGPGNDPAGFPFGCPAADLDEDGDVDFADFKTLQIEFTG